MAKNSTGERLDTRALGPVMLEHLHRYALVLDAVRNKRVLDVACGEGYGAALLAGTAASVTGADADAETIALAQVKYRQPNLGFVRADITALPFSDGEFDVVVSFETLEHVANHDAVLTELKRVLKPKGLLIISTPNKEEYSDNRDFANPFHVKELTAAGFEALLSAHFAHRRYWMQDCALVSLVCSADDACLRTNFTGNFTAVRQTDPLRPLYLIALASQQPLTVSLPSGLFRNDRLSRQYFEEERDSAKATASYKLGHFLLWPVKKLHSLFRKNPAGS